MCGIAGFNGDFSPSALKRMGEGAYTPPGVPDLPDASFSAGLAAFTNPKSIDE